MIQENSCHSLYHGGYHAFKKILRIDEDGSKVISRENKGFSHFGSDYVSSAWLNPNGTRVLYCLALDIDVRGTDKKWFDVEGKINWEKALTSLQKKYPEIFSYTQFVVRSTGGRGIHLGIAISPIVKDGSDGSNKTLFLAQQAQVALIRLLQSEGLGGDMAACGVLRDLPNWRRKHTSKYSQAKQLYYNQGIHARIKREGLNVISTILAATNKLKQCKPPAKREQAELIHPHKTTEARLAHLYVDLFDNLGQTKCYSMGELVKLTEISKATLRNVLVKRPKSRPKWLNVNYLGREGYELWLSPEFGDIDRALKLIQNPEYASTFLSKLKLPEEVIDGERNQWLSSAAIHYKWHGYSKIEALNALKGHAAMIPGHEESRSCKNLDRIVSSIYRNQPQLFGIRKALDLPVAIRENQKVKNNLEGPQRGSASAALSADCELTHYSLAFTRRGNEKQLITWNEKNDSTQIIASQPVKGTGYKLQLGAIQEVLRSLDTKPGKLIVKGNSMLQGNPVTEKFAKFYGLEFQFEQRTAEDKKLIKEFREEFPSSKSKFPFRFLNSNLSKKVAVSFKNKNWMLGLVWKLGRATVPPNVRCYFQHQELSSKSVASPVEESEVYKHLVIIGKMNLFRFPDLTEKTVRCDGYVGYLSNFYWLGESWIKRKLQVLDDGDSVEFYEKGQLICTYEKLKGKDRKTGGSHQPWARAKFRNSLYRKKALSVGPNFDRLVVHQIVKGDGIIQTNKIFAFLSLMDSWPYEQLEAVASYCVRRGNFTNRFFKSCLESGVE